ncbi:MAG TPA: lactonase family protein, partial [Pirellulales bacterium]|nr:lactonase family protein [Pirellulales bacterium]
LIAASTVLAADKLSEWTQTATFRADEAKQAAAADDRFVYVITNRLIAKYDRTSFARLAKSTGEATHLNSGFFWDGKLYCAHSNFPAKPEHSKILVLDPQSMQLTEFKDFGNYGGSLTWAVRRDDRWWCNFALYGGDNAKTFLVEFDDEWNELARWTYPPELIARIGKASLSGGVWLDDVLLVTDHDHPRLYTLRLAKERATLEFLGEQSAPITGQGIAFDPVTGGLVGINRAETRVVFFER